MAKDMVAAGSKAAAPAKAPGTAVQPRRRSSVALPANLAAYSNLDELDRQMALLNADLALIVTQLGVLKQTSASLDLNLLNMDEYSQHFEAPAGTRQAADAASAVAAEIDELTALTELNSKKAQVLNAQAFLALQAMRDAQDRQRARGAGPKLLASVNRY